MTKDQLKNTLKDLFYDYILEEVKADYFKKTNTIFKYNELIKSSFDNQLNYILNDILELFKISNIKKLYITYTNIEIEETGLIIINFKLSINYKYLFNEVVLI